MMYKFRYHYNNLSVHEENFGKNFHFDGGRCKETVFL